MGLMSSWGAIVVATPEGDSGGMMSRLPAYLHPVAGRPLIWHTVQALLQIGDAPAGTLVVGPDGTPDLLGDLPGEFVFVASDGSPGELTERLAALPERIVLVHAQSSIQTGALAELLRAPQGSWLGPAAGPVAVASVALEDARNLLEAGEPFGSGAGWRAEARIDGHTETFVVRTRQDLTRAHRRVREQLVRAIMDGGVTFLAPESVVVDVDVRIGRDTLVYPGVVLEGQTTIGDETVIGPGCRIVDSWIGSGVELKGWNYIAHTSVRNRAILEPYVRRGFD